MLANYKNERAAFTRLWEPRCQEPILLLVGQQGYGKTSLLEYCKQIVPSNIYQVSIDCNCDGITDIFYHIADCVGRENLPNTSKYFECRHYLPKLVEISNNQIRGNFNQIYVCANSGNEQEKDWRTYTTFFADSWLQDIKKNDKPLLLLIDNYEKARGDIHTWLFKVIGRLPQACPSLRIVVAGESVPSVKNSSCCEFELKGVPKPEDWLPVIDALGLQVPHLFLAGICHAMQGNPGEILKAIQRPF